MEIDIIKIGNSQGIRIPHHLLSQLGMEGKVEMEVKKDSLVIKSKAKKEPRKNWEETFAKYADVKGEELLDGYIPNKFDEEEWEW